MKRGLKVSAGYLWLGGSVVTTVTPMKRGLKAVSAMCTMIGLLRYNRYPDEKGTESGPVPAGADFCRELQPLPR